MDRTSWAVYNPHNKSLEDLPIITHELLQKAFKLNQEQGEKECPTPEK